MGSGDCAIRGSGQAGGEANLKMAEAAAQELLASAFNGKGDPERAVHYANYAATIARGMSLKIEADATEELAQAHEVLNRTEEAREAWLRFAKLEVERAGHAEAGSYGLFRAVSLIAHRRGTETYVDSYSQLHGIAASDRGLLSLGERLVDELPELIRNTSLEWSFENAVNHARFMFSDSPEAFVRYVFMIAVRRMLLEAKSDRDLLKSLRVILALSMALPAGVLRLSDVVGVGEVIARKYENVSFRPSPDGAAHWTVQIMLGRPVIVSVIQIDDQPEVSIVTLCICLVLVAFAREIFEDVLSAVAPQRSEANVQVCGYSDASQLFPLEKIGLDTEPKNCAVTRATDVTSDGGAPILAITSDTLTERWLPGRGQGIGGEELFANVLVEVIFHLQGGEVELESLYPKVTQLIVNTIG